MTGASDDGDHVVWYVVDLLEVARYDQIFIGDYAFDGCDDEFPFEAGGELFEVRFQVWRGGRQYEGVGFVYYFVDVGAEFYPVGVEGYVGEIGGVMPIALEVFDAVVAAHIP